jgi:glycosyltransferase involved in cell wall biosynthesis
MMFCVVVLPVRLFGGHERMLLEWLRAASAQHGVRVQVYCADNERLVRACEDAGLGPPAVRYPSRGGPVRDFFATWRLLAEVPRGVPVLFAPGVMQASPLQWLAALLRRRRVAGYVPMAYPSRHMGFRGGAVKDWLVRRIVRHVHLWITVSEQQRALLIEHWRPEAPVLVVPNRVVVPEHDAPQPKRDAEGRLRVLFAGRFDAKQKGLDWLCERLRARPERWVGRLRFSFMGEGEFQAELLRLSSDFGSRHAALLPWGDVGPVMENADVLLLPSRFEGMPLVALEAAHHGVPVAASRNAGLAELLPPSCLFDFGDEEGLWAVLERLERPAARAAALAYSRERIGHSLSAASFQRQIGRVVGELGRMGASPSLKELALR